MSEKIIEPSKKAVTVAEYQRIMGLSYETVMNLIKTNQVKFIKLPRGGYKIFLPSDDPDVTELNKRLERIESKFDRVLALFNMAAV